MREAFQLCRSKERGLDMLDRWQHALSQRAEGLLAALADFKSLLDQLRNNLHTECCSFKGCTSQEISDMIAEQCTPILEKIQKDCESLVTQATVDCKKQFANWSNLVIQLSSFATQYTTAVNNHSNKCAQVTSNAKKTFTLMLEQFDSDHRDVEGDFENLLEHVSAASEEDIEDRQQQAVDLLKTMKDGFHTAKQQAMAFVDRQLQALAEDCEVHGAQLQCLLHVGRPADERQADEGNADGTALEQQNASTDAGAEHADAGCIVIRSQKFVVVKDLFAVLLEPAVDPVTERVEEAEEHKTEAVSEGAQAHAEESNAEEDVDAADPQVRSHPSHNSWFCYTAIFSV